MILDLTVIPGSSVRYKPRNKAFCRGGLYYDGEEVANLKGLMIYQTLDPVSVVGGRFELEWFRKEVHGPFIHDDWSIQAEYGIGKPALLAVRWHIAKIQIVEEGVPLAISSLADLMQKEVAFFSTRMQVIPYPLATPMEVSHDS